MRSRHRATLLLNPAVLLLVLACLGFPFIAVSCEGPKGTIRADYSGWDMVVGGKPEYVGMRPGDVAAGDDTMSPQPLAVLTVVVLVIGALLVVLPRMTSLMWAIVAAEAALLLILNQFLVRERIISHLEQNTSFGETAGGVAGLVKTRHGFWISLALLLGLFLYNAVTAAISVVDRREQPTRRLVGGDRPSDPDRAL